MSLTAPIFASTPISPSVGNLMGGAADMLGSFIPQKKEYAGDKGTITAGIDSTTDTIANGLMQINPALGGIVKAGLFAGKGINALGGGTDGMTSVDAILGSNLGTIATLGLNGFTGKRADTMNKDYKSFATVGSSYGGTEQTVNNALKYSGKKYGGLSNSARKEANNIMADAGRKQWQIGRIADNATKQYELQSNMSDMLAQAQAFVRRGGLQPETITIGKQGMKIESEQEEWEDPDDVWFDFDSEKITCEEVEVYKEGGQMNLIPEGALHARKHHIEGEELNKQITQKGIPVIIDKGLGEVQQVAEIEHSEIVFNKETTTKLEELYHKFKKQESSKKEQDEYALEAGKLLTEQILNNTDDRVGLIDTV